MFLKRAMCENQDCKLQLLTVPDGISKSNLDILHWGIQHLKSTVEWNDMKS